MSDASSSAADARADLRGVICPFNFVKAKAALATIRSGQILELVLDEGDALLNVPRSLKEEGHAVLKVSPNEDETSYTLLVRKA